MTVTPPLDIDGLRELICIGLFADYDDLSIENARANWKAGFAYGAVGSDGHTALVQTADRIVEALAPFTAALLARLAEVEGGSEEQALAGGSWIKAEDVYALARRLDVAWNGDLAAKRPALCDVVGQLVHEIPLFCAALHLAESRATRAEGEARDALKFAGCTSLSQLASSYMTAQANWDLTLDRVEAAESALASLRARAGAVVEAAKEIDSDLLAIYVNKGMPTAIRLRDKLRACLSRYSEGEA